MMNAQLELPTAMLMLLAQTLRVPLHVHAMLASPEMVSHASMTMNALLELPTVMLMLPVLTTTEDLHVTAMQAILVMELHVHLLTIVLLLHVATQPMVVPMTIKAVTHVNALLDSMLDNLLPVIQHVTISMSVLSLLKSAALVVPAPIPVVHIPAPVPLAGTMSKVPMVKHAFQLSNVLLELPSVLTSTVIQT
jgi:hypothetical protein